MKTVALRLLALAGLGSVGLFATAPAVEALPLATLEQAASAAVTPVYHRGRPHRRARIVVHPRRYYEEPVPYFGDYSHYYPAVRGFGDRNPVARGNMRGCTVDLGYGRYESCDKN